MQLNDFKQQMTNVTIPVLNAYYQDIDNNWEQNVTGKYNSGIAYHLLKTLISTDEVDNENDLDEFVVETRNDLKQLIDETFADLTIYELTPKLTAQILNYFDQTGIDIAQHLTNAVLGNPQKFGDLASLETQINAYLYVVIDPQTDLAVELNFKIFAGHYSQTTSFERFLKQN